MSFFCLCNFSLCILNKRPMIMAPKAVIRRVIVRITAVTPGGQRHVITTACWRKDVSTFWAWPGHATQMPPRLSWPGSKLGCPWGHSDVTLPRILFWPPLWFPWQLRPPPPLYRNLQQWWLLVPLPLLLNFHHVFLDLFSVMIHLIPRAPGNTPSFWL